MKQIKKFASVLLALVMVMALAAPAFAGNNTPTGSITVKKAIPGETYKAYKLFDLSYGGTGVENEKLEAEVSGSNDPHTYSIAKTSPWYNFVTGTGDGTAYVDVDDQGYVTWKEGTDAAAFAQKALDYAETNAISPVNTQVAPTAAEGEETSEFTFSDLALGYYLIDSSLGALCALDSTNYHANVTEKNDVPSIKKTVEYADNTKIGDTVDFTIEVPIVKGATGYVIYDFMDNGLTYDAGSFKLDIYMYNEGREEWVPGGVEGLPVWGDTNKVTKTIEGKTKIFEVSMWDEMMTMMGSDGDDYKIVITYNATINKDAVEINYNTATLRYGNEHEVDSTVEVPLYEFDLVKTTSDGTVLEGAEFALYNEAAGGTPIAFVKDEETNTYRVAAAGEENTTTTIKAGVATIKGFVCGTYYLEETKQPTGYNKLTGRVDVEINGNMKAALDAEGKKYVANVEDDPETTEDESFTNSGVQVVNEAGTELPSTGGIGTTIFYVLGGVLVLGAVILLIAKRRTSVDDE